MGHCPDLTVSHQRLQVSVDRVGDRRKGEEIDWAPGVMGRVCGY